MTFVYKKEFIQVKKNRMNKYQLLKLFKNDSDEEANKNDY